MLALLSSSAVAFNALNLNKPLLTPARAAVSMGFEIEDVEQKALEEMGVFGWPGLEKRAEDFSQSAADDELLMVYVKDGSATLTDSEESLPVKAGQMVMVSAGDVRWSGIASGGVTLLSTSTSLVDVDEFSVDQGSMVDASKVVDAIKAEDEEVKDLDLKEAGLLLAAGLAAGAVFSFGFNTFMAP